VHKKMPELVRDAARRSAAAGAGVAGGQVSEADLFDDSYKPIPIPVRRSTAPASMR
jgi:hypothetical protein